MSKGLQYNKKVEILLKYNASNFPIAFHYCNKMLKKMLHKFIHTYIHTYMNDAWMVHEWIDAIQSASFPNICLQGQKIRNNLLQTVEMRFERESKHSTKNVKNVKRDSVQKYTKLTPYIEVLNKEEIYWKMRIYNCGHKIMDVFWPDINFYNVKSEKKGYYYW